MESGLKTSIMHVVKCVEKQKEEGQEPQCQSLIQHEQAQLLMTFCLY